MYTLRLDITCIKAPSHPLLPITSITNICMNCLMKHLVKMLTSAHYVYHQNVYTTCHQNTNNMPPNYAQHANKIRATCHQNMYNMY